jgi:hypothetical protein
MIKKTHGAILYGSVYLACHHITITQMVYGHVLQTIKLLIHQPTEWSKKNKLYIVTTTNLLAVYKQPHIKNGYVWFSLNGQISRSMKLEKLLVWY